MHRGIRPTATMLGAICCLYLGLSAATVMPAAEAAPAIKTLAQPVKAPASARAASAIVTLTFDNSYESQFTNALPIMQKYKIKGTVFLETQDMAEETTDGMFTMSWPQASQWWQAGWELGSHSISNPDMTTLAGDQAEIEFGVSWALIAKHTEALPYAFASPLGRFNDTLLAALHSLYGAHVATVEGTDTEPFAGFNHGDSVDPYRISRLLVMRDTPAKTICDDVAWAVKEKLWLVLAFDQVVPVPLTTDDGVYQVSTDTLTTIASCVAAEQARGTLKAEGIKQALTGTP